ncbi:TPA: hypothetical protein I7730_01500 [Vibrio vulnificus]|uniref:Uncharacterized protein n=1 Tax=Vibrio vulnificus TaxID=672 RepID=A0A8H9K7B4_VIBVL|nr:hypothetical protein [Vibrio vulnificus]HAS8538472.1 hypothetical protein [Vibrio vulnificus]
MNFINAWYFLQEHRVFNCLEVTILPENQKPTSKRKISSRRSYFDESLTILVLESDNQESHKICLEAGPILIDENNQIAFSHDYALDVYEDTFERAVISLAEQVSEVYGTCMTTNIIERTTEA